MIDILIIEDNIELASVLGDFLVRDGYTYVHVESGESALFYLSNNPVKLVLLDLMLPGIDGFGVCQSLRQVSNIPILILSAKVEKSDKLAGLELGADDYIEKPFDMDLLLAKIKSQFRRSYERMAQPQLLVSGEITMDLSATVVYYKGAPLIMTVKEYELLKIFLENPGKSLRKDWLFNKVWGIDSFSEPSTLTVHINKLREKIEALPKEPKRIITVWGVGYRYEAI